MGKCVESVIPIKDVREAAELKHSHDNKSLLDILTSDGSSAKYLGADGHYHDIPEDFSVDAFIEKLNTVDGNVLATKDSSDNLVLIADNRFAEQLDDKVIGSIEIEQASNKQLDVSIAEVDVNTGEIYENPIHYITAGLGVSVGFLNNAIAIGLIPNEGPFASKMDKQAGATVGRVAIFDASGQVIDGSVLLSALATYAQLTEHTGDDSIHTNTTEKSYWNAKQPALTEPQQSAVDSGITAGRVSTYDGYATSKQSVGGNTPNRALVTDSEGNIVTEIKFDPLTKVDKVPSAVQNRVASFTADGNIKDSNVILGSFPSETSVREYVDTSISTAVSGSVYQGAFTYFGSQLQVESVVGAMDGDTAIIYLGEINNLAGLERGDYDGESWTFAPVVPVPSGGAWFEIDQVLTNEPIISGRIIVRMDGVHDPSLDVRPSAAIPLDDTTIGLNHIGQSSFKQRVLGSGKSVLNATDADSIAYAFTDDGGQDITKSIKEVIDENKLVADGESIIDTLGVLGLSTELLNKIDAAEKNVQSDWNETDDESDAFIQNKPILAPSDAQKNVQSDWNETDSGSDAYIKNKPKEMTETLLALIDLQPILLMEDGMPLLGEEGKAILLEDAYPYLRLE